MLNRAVVSAVSLVCVVLAGCEDDVPKPASVRPVRTIAVEPGSFRQFVKVIGDIRPRRESDLGFRVSGKVIARAATVGSPVRAGDVVARLEDDDYRNRVKQADADVKAAQAVYQEAAANEARQRMLKTNGITTRVNYDAARKTLLSAEAGLQSARVALRMARDQLDHTVLKAEFDGIITATGAEIGQVVASAQMIVRLAPSGERDAVFAIAETAIRRGGFGIGAPVRVALLSEPGVTATGAIREISPIADPATRTFDVRVAVDASAGSMLFGASVDGVFAGHGETGIALPPEAIFDGNGKPAVWLYSREKGAVTLHPVAIARYEDDRVIVSGGLARGDLVVTAGVNRLREGQPVKLEGEEAL